MSTNDAQRMGFTAPPGVGSPAADRPALRYFGRCRVKGCKHRRVIEVKSSPQLRRFEGVRHGDVLAVLDEAGNDFPLYYLGMREQERAMRGAGFVCPEHNVTVYFERGQFRYDPGKVCNAKCMGATGPACSCSCRGENHGARFV